MNKNEFLVILENTLKGEIPDHEISGHIQYYDSYICGNNGKTEEEILEELGDPRLIARTIIAARTPKEDQEPYGQMQYEEDSRNRESGQSRSSYKSYTKTYTWEGLAWYQKLLVVLILFFVVVLLIAIAGLGIQIFFSVILPVLVIVFIIKVILSFFR